MTTQEHLIDKSKEAFVMAIEIYNKPSIRYRLEGFSFFICNAWSYSQQAIDFIYDEIKKSPRTLLDDLKKKCAKK